MCSLGHDRGVRLLDPFPAQHRNDDDYHPHNNSASTLSSSASSIHEDGSTSPSKGKLQRPKLTSRKSSGTIIVPREHPRLELKEGDEVFDEDDARAMSPRRNSEDLEKMSKDAREQLSE
ncbi:hypothetical protein B7494_g476 [Chlorociboria aeruginascens]|nr:hypothetical protein B7494_g476 [Chlorociboria aeruginascens]